MSFSTRHEMQIQGDWNEPRVMICCEGMAHTDGEGSLRFWLETRHPDKIDWDTGDVRPERTVEHGSATVYSYELVTARKGRGTEYRKADPPWHLREMVIALARGDVGGKSAGSMIYHVFWYTVAKKAPDWLVKNAPEWWKLVDPKRREQQEEVKA